MTLFKGLNVTIFFVPPLSLCLCVSLQLVRGEVYAVDRAMLDRLDQLEDHPNLYQRMAVQCVLLEEGQGQWAGRGVEEVVDTETYFLTDYREELLKLPYIANYGDTPSVVEQYFPKSERETAAELYKDVKKQY